MTVSILIKRNVSAEKAEKLRDLIRQLRALVVNQPGYVHGESLKNIENPEEYLVISKWETLDAWKKWVESKERASIQEQIDALLGKETKYEMYERRS